MKPILTCLLFFIGLSAYAQHTVVVNPDGTHSVIINNGNVSTIVNPDGTHSTAIMNGNSTTIVNPKERKVWQIINSNHKKKSAKKHDNKHTETDN